jgi:predicted nucleotidyltransferase
MTDFGLDKSILKKIVQVITRYPSVSKATIYGSRAKGNYKNSSDIDIAIHASSMSEDDFAKLCFELNELPIVFKIDVVHVESLTDRKLVDKISEEEKKIL